MDTIVTIIVVLLVLAAVYFGYMYFQKKTSPDAILKSVAASLKAKLPSAMSMPYTGGSAAADQAYRALMKSGDTTNLSKLMPPSFSSGAKSQGNWASNTLNKQGWAKFVKASASHRYAAAPRELGRHPKGSCSSDIRGPPKMRNLSGKGFPFGGSTEYEEAMLRNTGKYSNDYNFSF
jgi:hypothetical protein